MSKLVIVTMTADEALTVRMALNGASIEWGAKANAYRNAGNDVGAATCERIRAEHGVLWQRVADAMARPGGCCHFHSTGGNALLSCGGDAADDLNASQMRWRDRGAARETARVAAECDALEGDIPY